MAKKSKQPPKLWRDVAAHKEAHQGKFVPDEDNPYCLKCGLCALGSKRFLGPQGSDDPWVTVVVDGVGWREDDAGEVAVEDSANGTVRKNLEEMAESINFPLDRIRWLPMTRCANRSKTQVDYKVKGNWCRAFAVDDLTQHPPRLVLAIGSTALGLLSHKSNAFDWAGKVLTWRGWPDDWLTSAQYDEGHPALPRPPVTEIPLYATQSSRIIFALQNSRETARWKGQLKEALEYAAEGAEIPDYDRPYFSFLEDPDAVIEALKAIPDDALVTYDSETKGLLQWAQNAAIVAMMFRYDGPDGPVCFGFPWDFEESALKSHLPRIIPVLLDTFYRVRLQGHNLTFDILYAYATLPGADLRRLTDAMGFDTRHLIYTLHQTKESLGLELVAYRWCPEMSGYEEEFTLIKDHTGLSDYLDPGMEAGGHYSRALLLGDDVRKAYITYIMGDVEVCHVSGDAIREKLDNARIYPFPIADPNRLGEFRMFSPPPRRFVYDKIMLPSNRMLTRLMGRGMHVDVAELAHQENIFPKMIKAARAQLRKMDDRVAQWCEEQEATVVLKNGQPWILDLESREQLKHILFNVMALPVKRLTKTGLKKYKDTELADMTVEERLEYAAVDKYTINALAAEHKGLVAPLQEYRKLYKAYTAFVRSMRNITTEGVDKHDRKQPPYLQSDGRVHASFNLCGTRSGRLGCSRPNLAQLPSSQKVIVKRIYNSRYGDEGCIYQGDLSQIELRLLAAASGDPLMVDAYRRNIDLHSLTASHIFEIPYEHLHKDYFAWLQKNGREKEAKELERKRSIAKCVDPLTLVSVDGKIIRIGSIHPGRDIDKYYPITGKVVQVGPHGGSGEIRHFYSGGVKKKVLICARKGLLACTPNHKFLLHDGTQVEAADLKKGMQLADVVPLNHACDEGKTISLPINIFGKGMNNENLNYSCRVDGDMSYLLGVLYGDGNVNENYSAISTGGDERFFKWQDIIAECATKLGIDAKIIRTEFSGTKVSEKLGPITGSYGKVVLGSRRVLDLFEQLGAVERTENKLSKTLKIPVWLLNAPKHLKLSFFAGLIDTDGCVKTSDASISFCTKSWRLAQDVIVMLRSVGIESTLYPSWNSTYEKYYFVVNVPVSYACQLRGYLRHPDKASKLREPKCTSGRVKTENLVTATLEIPDGEVVDISLDDPHLYVPEGLTTHQTTNFLTGYGGGAFGLQTTLAEEQVYLDQEECENIIDAMFDTYPVLRKYIGIYKQFILEHGCAVSIFGRVRPLPEVESEDQQLVNKALRAGFNHLIQSTASDMMLLAMDVIDRTLFDEGLESCLVSTVHDSLVIDARISELPKVHDIVDCVINNLPDILDSLLGPDYNSDWCRVLPLTGDCEVGRNYHDQSKMDSFKDSSGVVDWEKAREFLHATPAASDQSTPDADLSH